MPGLRDNRTLSALVRWLCWGQVAMLVLVVATGALAVQGGDLKGELGPLAMTAAFTALARALLFLITAVVAMIWLYRATANAQAMGASDLMVSPIMAALWWIVPLMNLFMPYLAVRDLWRASERPRDWQGVSAPATILVWWILWICAGIAGAVGFGMSTDLYVPPEVLLYADIVSALFFIPAALLFAGFVGDIQRKQEGSGPAQAFR